MSEVEVMPESSAGDEISLDTYSCEESDEEEEEEEEEEEDYREKSHDLLYKNTSSFRCLAQLEISRSSLLFDPFHWFPAVEDPRLDNALWSDPLHSGHDNTGRIKYLDACKDEKVVAYRRVLDSLDQDVLDLTFYGLREREVKAVCAALSINEYIKNVSLQENRLSPEGVRYVNDMLLHNTTLTKLDMRECRVGPEGAERFLNGFAFNGSLQELDLSYNDIGDDGAAHLANALKLNNTIRKLNLSHNHLNDKSLEYLASAMVENYAINDLDLSWNHLFKSAGMGMFVDGLSENLALKKLNLSWCGIGDRDNMRELYRYLRTDTAKLEFLDLSYNRIFDVAVKMLRSALRYNENLETLLLVGNPMTPDDVEWIAGSFMDKRATPTPLSLIDCSGLPVKKSFFKVRNQIKKMGGTIKVGEILANYKVHGPNIERMVLSRMKFVALTQKEKKFRTDFGVFLLKLPDATMTVIEFQDLMTANKVRLDNDLMDYFLKLFAGEAAEFLDMKHIKEVYMEMYPDTKIVEKKKKKGRKKKKGKDKASSEAVTTTEGTTTAALTSEGEDTSTQTTEPLSSVKMQSMSLEELISQSKARLERAFSLDEAMRGGSNVNIPTSTQSLAVTPQLSTGTMPDRSQSSVKEKSKSKKSVTVSENVVNAA